MWVRHPDVYLFVVGDEGRTCQRDLARISVARAVQMSAFGITSVLSVATGAAELGSVLKRVFELVLRALPELRR